MSRFRIISALALLATAGLPAGAAAASSGASIKAEAPSGFENLEQPREMLADVYFGGRRLGEVWIVARPGFVKFKNPEQLLVLLPELKHSPELDLRLASEFIDHAALACGSSPTPGCGKLEPQLLELVFDQDRFRIDLFVAPDRLAVASVVEAYLPSPGASLSLTSALGGAISGSTRGATNYNFQNRTILGFRNGRLRTDSGYATDLGFIVDDFVAEIDTRKHRHSAGLFWAPGIDFTGRRRIAGLGFSTQFDTHAAQEALEATPLIVFLSQPSRVELLIDGRLITSASYDAGNRAIDSAVLPSGSYPLVLRVQGPDGSIREERRFFVKNSTIAPLGKPVYYAYGGLLANTRADHPVSLSKSFYYQLGAAYRLRESLAVDAAIIGTESKPIAQLGAYLITDLARVRAAGLVSSGGDAGLLLQVSSGGLGRLNFNLDVRRVWSRSGKPLIPLPTYIDNFGSVPAVGTQAMSGSYTQAIGSVGYSLGGAFLGLTGSYRRDERFRSDYSVGPSLSWPIFNRGGLQFVINADAQWSRSTTAAFAGFRIQHNRGGFSTVTTSGFASLRKKGEDRRSRPVGRLSAQWFHESGDRTQVALEGALHRDVETTTALANANVATSLGTGRAEVLQSIEGRGGTQFGLTFQTGMAFGRRTLEIGGRDLNQSAIIAELGGSAGGSIFEILIDGVPRGRLTSGSRLPIFLEAYRSYQLRLRPIGAVPMAYDSGSRSVTLYPGTVEKLTWDAQRLVTFFGQAVRVDGRPVINASINLAKGIGQTDANGYFQVDAVAGDVLKFREGDHETCEVSLGAVEAKDDYTRLGKVVCQ